MPLAGDFSTIYQPPLDRITVFVASDNGHLYDKYWNGREWVWDCLLYTSPSPRDRG